MNQIYRRTPEWTVVRTVEWVVLAVSVAVAAADALTVHGSGLPVPAWVLAVAALLSKAGRAVLATARGMESSTLSPASWLVAVLLAVLAAVEPDLVPEPAHPLVQPVQVPTGTAEEVRYVVDVAATSDGPAGLGVADGVGGAPDAPVATSADAAPDTPTAAPEEVMP